MSTSSTSSTRPAVARRRLRCERLTARAAARRGGRPLPLRPAAEARPDPKGAGTGRRPATGRPASGGAGVTGVHSSVFDTCPSSPDVGTARVSRRGSSSSFTPVTVMNGGHRDKCANDPRRRKRLLGAWVVFTASRRAVHTRSRGHHAQPREQRADRRRFRAAHAPCQQSDAFSAARKPPRCRQRPPEDLRQGPKRTVLAQAEGCSRTAGCDGLWV